MISYIKLGKSDCDVFLLLGRPFAFKKIKGIQGLMKYHLLKLGCIHWVSMAKSNLNKTKQTMTTRSKCFTYVTKTIANLTTYSRKPVDYDASAIIF